MPHTKESHPAPVRIHREDFSILHERDASVLPGKGGVGWNINNRDHKSQQPITPNSVSEFHKLIHS
jgi:hypothetical protein